MKTICKKIVLIALIFFIDKKLSIYKKVYEQYLDNKVVIKIDRSI